MQRDGGTTIRMDDVAIGDDWIGPSVTPPDAAPSPFKRWDGTQYVDLDAYRWDGAGYTPIHAT